MIKQFEANRRGRDFCIGDLHGAYAVLERLLDGLNFDPTVDRLFSTGDLCDRGDESLKCLELLHQNWFHAVPGNHELMVLDAFANGPGPIWPSRNGGAWAIEALNTWWHNQREVTKRPPSDDEHRLYDLLPLINELPMIMTVKRRDGSKVHIIHAEFCPVELITDEDLEDPDRLRRIISARGVEGEWISWGRYQFNPFFRENLSNVKKIKRTVAYRNARGSIFNDDLSHIISGHTMLQRPMTILGQTCIDTSACGAVMTDSRPWEKLTAVDINAWKFYQANRTDFAEVEPLVISQADIDDVLSLNTSSSEGE